MLNQMKRLTDKEIEKIKTSPAYFFNTYCFFKNGLLDTFSYLPSFVDDDFFDGSDKPDDDWMYFLKMQYKKTIEEIEKKADEKSQYEKGREDALKNCPKWKKAEEDIMSDTIDYAIKYRIDGGDYPDYDTVVVTNRLKRGDYYIELSELENLLTEN